MDIDRKVQLTTFMTPKIEILKSLMSDNEWDKALKLAASWPHLGAHKKPIEQAWAAHTNPGFYRQIGKDPKALRDAGIDALKQRYLPH